MKHFDEYLKFGERTGLKLGQARGLNQSLDFFFWIVFDLFSYCVIVKSIYKFVRILQMSEKKGLTVL